MRRYHPFLGLGHPIGSSGPTGVSAGRNIIFWREHTAKIRRDVNTGVSPDKTLCSSQGHTQLFVPGSTARRDRVLALDSKIERRLESETPACLVAEEYRLWRRRRQRRRDEGPPRGRRTLTGREASQEDYRKQIISVEIPLPNSLSTLPQRSVSAPKLPAEFPGTKGSSRSSLQRATRSALTAAVGHRR